MTKIINVPVAYKAGKLYSLFPVDGSGDFTTTRALDTATRFNSLGIRETVLANVPRIDHSHGACGELLVEPTRTNLFVSPDTLATQNVTTEANYYAVSFEGTGTITYGYLCWQFSGNGCNKQSIFSILSNSRNVNLHS